jgi:hypothetical protein
VEKKIVQSPAILKMLMDPESSDNSTDFSDVLAVMARNSESVSMQMAESYLKGTQKGTVQSLKSL